MDNRRFTTVDEYIATFNGAARESLIAIRKLIKETVPRAEESISYNIPAYKLNGPLIYFAAYKNHIGVYALPSAHKAFKEELSGYKQGKGSVQFPLDKPMPLALIKAMLLFRTEGNNRK